MLVKFKLYAVKTVSRLSDCPCAWVKLWAYLQRYSSSTLWTDMQKNEANHCKSCEPVACYRSLSGPKCPGSVPESGPRKWGVSEGVPHGVSPGLGSVQKVSRECAWSLLNAFTLATLFGHSRARGLKGPGGTP